MTSPEEACQKSCDPAEEELSEDQGAFSPAANAETKHKEFGDSSQVMYANELFIFD